MKAPIQSVKHYVQMSLTTVAAGTAVVTSIAEAAEAVGGNANSVRIGAVVKAIYIELWTVGQSNEGAVQVVFGKARAGSGGPSFAEIANLHDYNEKNTVFFFSQGLSNEGNSLANPTMRGWYKIPKGMQRLANGEKWYIAVAALALGQNFCGMVTYKEYF